MAKFIITLKNIGGELDKREFEGDEDDLASAIADFVLEIGNFRDGDTICIAEFTNNPKVKR